MPQAAENAAISFEDTVIANHTGAIVACVPSYGGAAPASTAAQPAASGGDRRRPGAGSGEDSLGPPPIIFRRCAAVQNQPEGGRLGHGQQHGVGERVVNNEDALIDLGKCLNPPAVLIENTVWIDNGLAVIHTGTSAVVVRGSTFSGGESQLSAPALFSFGGALTLLDSQFEQLGSLATCRHIADCYVLIDGCRLSGGGSGAMLSMCSGGGLSIRETTFDGAKAGTHLLLPPPSLIPCRMRFAQLVDVVATENSLRSRRTHVMLCRSASCLAGLGLRTGTDEWAQAQYSAVPLCTRRASTPAAQRMLLIVQMGVVAPSGRCPVAQYQSVRQTPQPAGLAVLNQAGAVRRRSTVSAKAVWTTHRRTMVVRKTAPFVLVNPS